MVIPKIIHQTYKHKWPLPQTYEMCKHRIQKLHPDFEYRFYSDDDMYSEMKQHFPEYFEDFMKLPRIIMKIDMFRYFLMYKYGGLYADMDYYMMKPFDILNEEIVIPCNLENNDKPCRLGNCVFASRPSHPFWKSVIDTLFTIDRTHLKSDRDVLGYEYGTGTGPGFLTAMWKKWITSHNEPNDITIPRKHLFHPVTNVNDIKTLQEQQICYGMHLCTGLWVNNKL